MKEQERPNRARLVGGLVLTTLLAHAPLVFAEDNVWTGGSGNDWSTAQNWSLGTVPTEGQNVSIKNGAQVYLYTTTTPSLANLSVLGGNTKLTQYGGSLDTTAMLVDGGASYRPADYYLSSGTLQAAAVTIGDTALASFTQLYSSVNITGNLTLGKQQGGGAYYYLGKRNSLSGGAYDGGSLKAADFIIGDAGFGELQQLASATTITGTLTLGKQQEGYARYFLGTDQYGGIGGGTLQAANLIVADAGYGWLAQIKSATTITDTLTLGKQQGSFGEYDIDGGSLQAANVIIGDAGEGWFTQIESATTITDTLTVGKQQGRPGVYTLGEYYTYLYDNPRGGGTLKAANVIIGDAGEGKLQQIESATTITDTIILGKQQDGVGYYYLGQYDDGTSGGTLQTTDLIVGDAGRGHFNQIAATTSIAETLTLGKQQGSHGYYSMGKAEWGLSEDFDFASDAYEITPQVVAMGGGTLQVTNVIVGDAGYSEIYQIDSATTIDDTLTLGKQQGGYGSYSMGKLIWDSQWITYLDIENEADVTVNIMKFMGTAGGGTLQAANLIIGDAGTGYFSQFASATGNSTTTITDTLTLGKQQGGFGSYSMGKAELVWGWDFDDLNGVAYEITQFVTTGGGTLQAANVIIGDAGKGSFSQIDSATAVTNTLTLGKQQGGAGSYSLGAYDSSYGGGTLHATDLIVGDAGKGSFRQTSSTDVSSATTITDTLTVAKQSGSEGYVKISGGTLSADHIVVGVDGHGEMAQSGGAVTADTMTISGNSTVSLSGGTLRLNDSLTNNGLLTLTQAGLLTVENTFTNTGTLVIDLKNYNGKSFITLNNSTADLDGTLQIRGISSPNTEMAFTLISAAHGFSTTSDLIFSYLNLPTFVGFHWEYGLSESGDAYLLSLKSGPSPVPVPSSILLLGSGLVLMARRRRHPTLQ